MKRILSAILLLLCFTLAQGKVPDNSIRLWEGIKSVKSNLSRMWVYQAADSINTGIGVIICPGGSYSHTMGIATEGFDVAEWLSSRGINCFVLKYRTGNRGWHHPAMIEDAQRALQLVRENSTELGIDPLRIGIVGFSAGGHLALMSAEFMASDFLTPLGLDVKCSLSPNFVGAIYPVVSMENDLVHERSRRNLLGRNFSQDDINRFSMNLSVSGEMAPVFISACRDDKVVNYLNSVAMDKSLTYHKVPHTYILYDTGNHGYGGDEKKAPEAAMWKYEFLKWLENVHTGN
ncbi:MAG: alpha/beta hydrolase [Bacteroidales bacterium]|nr:alpha/beta hydrolase [Bacteroidales bacterium]